MSKPFSPREVCLRVKTILRRMPAPDGAPRAATASAALAPNATNGFELDAAGQRIRYATQWLDLTRRELHLLQLLLQRPGHIYSRETPVSYTHLDVYKRQQQISFLSMS